MTPTDNALLQWIFQGGFAALFIWLFWDTRREARMREAELTKLAQSLQATIDHKIDDLHIAMKAHDLWARTVAKERHDVGDGG